MRFAIVLAMVLRICSSIATGFLLPSVATTTPTSIRTAEAYHRHTDAVGLSSAAPESPPPILDRRKAFVASFGMVALLVSTTTPSPATAFDNGIPESENFRDKTKFPGSPPIPLGVQPNGKLSACDPGGLNCFSTTGETGSDDDDDTHRIPLWKPPKGMSQQKAMTDLLETIEAYPPGQQRIDKGGFSIVTNTNNADANEGYYLYVQFESMKHGFIDDVEFAIAGDPTSNNNRNNKSSKSGARAGGPSTNGGDSQPVVQVRSSSRIGSLDLGVNAKRLNRISADLRARGWTAPQITPQDYPDYFNTLVFTFDDYIRSVLSPEDCPVPAEPLRCKNPSAKTNIVF